MKKLLNSKWTAVSPQNKEKHFVVTKVKTNDEDDQVIDWIILTAVMTGREQRLDPKVLKDELVWKQGWKQ